MKGILTAMAALAMMAGVQAGSIISTDFGACTIAIADKLNRENPNISGKVPAGWADDSHWGQAKMVYEPTGEGGIDFLRIQVPAPGSGKPGALVNMNVPEMTGKTVYTLAFRARNVGQTVVTIGIRMKEKPWSMLGCKVGKLSTDWQDYRETYTLDVKDTPLGLWIMMPPGTVLDLKSLELTAEPAQ
jgi:hypothetical protein